MKKVWILFQVEWGHFDPSRYSKHINHPYDSVCGSLSLVQATCYSFSPFIIRSTDRIILHSPARTCGLQRESKSLRIYNIALVQIQCFIWKSGYFSTFNVIPIAILPSCSRHQLRLCEREGESEREARVRKGKGTKRKETAEGERKGRRERTVSDEALAFLSSKPLFPLIPPR